MRKPNRIARWLALFSGAYVLLSIVAGIALANMALHPARLPLRHRAQAAAAAAQFGALLEDVQVTAADGARLKGWYARPRSSNGSAVVLLHGVSDNREGMFGYAEMFLSQGYSVVLPDSRAHGESGGTIATYGQLESDDIHRWVDWVKAHDQPRCVYGFGESMGAGLVMQSLTVEKRFCAIVAESGFATFREAAFERVAGNLHTRPWVAKTILRPAVALAFLYARVRYGVDVQRVSPEAAVTNSTTPVLLIHGMADTNLYPCNSEEIASRAPRVKLWEPRGAGHCGAISVAPGEFEDRVLREFSGVPAGEDARGTAGGTPALR